MDQREAPHWSQETGQVKIEAVVSCAELYFWLGLMPVVGRPKLRLVRGQLLVLRSRSGHHRGVERLAWGQKGGMGEGGSHARASGRVEHPWFPSVQDKCPRCPLCHLPVQQSLGGGKDEGSGTGLLPRLKTEVGANCIRLWAAALNEKLAQRVHWSEGGEEKSTYSYNEAAFDIKRNLTVS